MIFEKLISRRLLERLEEDVLPEDITSKAVKGVKCRAYVVAKEEGLLAGNKFLVPFLEDLQLKVIEAKPDGNYFKKGDKCLFSKDTEKTS
ncbi:hypothetical protein WIW89_11635 [Stygiolobus sp. CP850M]|jgi:nicotinate-nucleotide pyrophosphorylase (carboxylating)|uniref:hypothetical protein n=1 Tax=Stygiolobus sp. CP850M TaxID=3133134 RepID=UPI00307F0126